MTDLFPFRAFQKTEPVGAADRSPQLNAEACFLRMPMTSQTIRAEWWNTCSFWLRVILLSILSSPFLCAQEDTATSNRPGLPAPPSATSPEGLPAPTRVESDAEQGNVVPPVPQVAEAETVRWTGTADCPYYWMVSSRSSVQNIHSPGRWGLDVHQRLPDGSIQPSSVGSLSAQIDPTLPVCIFVHGSFVKWESQCREAHQAYREIRRQCPGMPVQMIFFTWPSDGPYTYLLPLDVAVRGEQAEFNGFHLAWLISQLPTGCPVCLIGHSHGTRVVLSALQLAGGGEIQDHCFAGGMGCHRYRAILTAAAMDNEWLNPGQRYDRALLVTEGLLHLQNRRDAALGLYPLSRPFAGRALARSGFRRRDLARIGSQSAKIMEYDCTHLLGPAHLWPDYYSKPEIVATMRPYIYFY